LLLFRLRVLLARDAAVPLVDVANLLRIELVATVLLQELGDAQIDRTAKARRVVVQVHHPPTPAPPN